MFVKSTVIYLDTSTFSEKTRCNFGVAMATIRWLLSLCYSNNRNQYSKPVLYVKVEDTCSQVLWQKGSSRKTIGSDARQSELDLFHSWAVVLPRFLKSGQVVS